MDKELIERSLTARIRERTETKLSKADLSKQTIQITGQKLTQNQTIDRLAVWSFWFALSSQRFAPPTHARDKAEGWQRDLSDKVSEQVRSELVRTLVRTAYARDEVRTDREIESWPCGCWPGC